MENYRLGCGKDLLRVELLNNGVTFKIRLIAENPIKTKRSIIYFYINIFDIIEK